MMSYYNKILDTLGFILCPTPTLTPTPTPTPTPTKRKLPVRWRLNTKTKPPIQKLGCIEGLSIQ